MIMMKQKKKSFVWHAGITVKLFTAMLITILIPVVICMTLVAQWLLQYEKSTYTQALYSSIMQVKSSISEKIELCAQTARLLASDNNMTAFLQNTKMSDTYKVQEMVQVLVPKLNSAALSNKYIHHIRLLHANTVIPDVYDVVYFQEDVSSGAWRDRLTAMNQPRELAAQIYISGVEEETSYFAPAASKHKGKVYNIYCPVHSGNYTKIVGIIEVSVRLEDILESLEGVQLYNGEVLQLYSEKSGYVHSSSQDFYIPEAESGVFSAGTSQVQWRDNRYQTQSTYIDILDAWLLLYIPENISVGSYYRNIVLVTIFIGILLFALVGLSISKLVSENIQSIVAVIRQMEQGNLQAKAEIHSGDELEYLAGHINSMAEKLDASQQQTRAANEAQRDAMFAALEHQMKPHFLCNALDFVRMNAELRDDHVAADSIYWIMRYFHYNMDSRRSFVKLKTELTNVRDFISIYNLVTHRKVELLLDVAPEITEKLDEFYILKYTLQPVVENAVKHAFADTDTERLITLELEWSEQQGARQIVIHVEDNGEGMDEAALAALERGIKDADAATDNLRQSYKGISLANIYQRMRLIYKSGYDLSVESYVHAGTRITLVIPAWNEEPEGLV